MLIIRMMLVSVVKVVMFWCVLGLMNNGRNVM